MSKRAGRCGVLRQPDRFDADAWPLVEAVVLDRGPLEVDRLTRLVRPLIHLHGWRGERGEAFDARSLWGELLPLLCQAEAYGLIRRDPA